MKHDPGRIALSCTHSLSSPMVPQHQKGPVPSWKHRWEETQWNYIFERGAAGCWNVCGGSTGYTEAGSSRHLNAFGYWFVWKSGTINLDRVSMFIISFPFLVAICCHDFGASKSADTAHFLRSQPHHRWQVKEPGTRPEMACLQFGNEYDISFHTVGRNPTLPWMFFILSPPSNWCRISQPSTVLSRAVWFAKPAAIPHAGEGHAGIHSKGNPVVAHHPQVMTRWYPRLWTLSWCK